MSTDFKTEVSERGSAIADRPMAGVLHKARKEMPRHPGEAISCSAVGILREKIPNHGRLGSLHVLLLEPHSSHFPTRAEVMPYT